MIKIGIAGATGYSGEELVTCLLKHKEARITSLSSFSTKEAPYSSIFPVFKGKIDSYCGKFNLNEICKTCDLVFLALPHTESMKYAPKFIEKGIKVIDLSADYRLPASLYKKNYHTSHKDLKNLKKAVYGLPEINRLKIKRASLIANPGCYPTSVILGLLPIIKKLASKSLEPIVDSKSGVTGAGRKAYPPDSFGDVEESLKCYKANDHQHIPEMEGVLSEKAGKKIVINFTPHVMPIRRGIMSTIYIKHKGMPDEKKIARIYEDHYKGEPFVKIMPHGVFPEIRDVRNTNFCYIGIKVSRGMLIIISVIDNLLKGAAGQAVQNMNIMCGFNEKEGLV